jgi:hypothetical protein
LEKAKVYTIADSFHMTELCTLDAYDFEKIVRQEEAKEGKWRHTTQAEREGAVISLHPELGT